LSALSSYVLGKAKESVKYAGSPTVIPSPQSISFIISSKIQLMD